MKGGVHHSGHPWGRFTITVILIHTPVVPWPGFASSFILSYKTTNILSSIKWIYQYFTFSIHKTENASISLTSTHPHCFFNSQETHVSDSTGLEMIFHYFVYIPSSVYRMLPRLCFQMFLKCSHFPVHFHLIHKENKLTCQLRQTSSRDDAW